METNDASNSKTDDGYLAAGILIAAVIIVLVVGFYFWRQNRIAATGGVGDNRYGEWIFNKLPQLLTYTKYNY